MRRWWRIWVWIGATTTSTPSCTRAASTACCSSCPHSCASSSRRGAVRHQPRGAKSLCADSAADVTGRRHWHQDAERAQLVSGHVVCARTEAQRPQRPLPLLPDGARRVDRRWPGSRLARCADGRRAPFPHAPHDAHARSSPQLRARSSRSSSGCECPTAASTTCARRPGVPDTGASQLTSCMLAVAYFQAGRRALQAIQAGGCNVCLARRAHRCVPPRMPAAVAVAY